MYQLWYQAYYNFDPAASALFFKFTQEIVTKMINYAMPVITLEKETPKEAVDAYLETHWIRVCF